MDRAKAYFKGKKVTVLGLGLLGKGLGDAAFLAECGAQVTVTDLKSAKDLAPSVAVLKKYKNIRYVLGRHDFADFENADMVVKAQGVRLDSLYVAHARKNNIPVRMDDELFISLAPKNVTIIGVTGTRGKTTTASLIYHILKKSGKSVHLGGNIRGVATLALLKKIRSGDFVVLELSSWQLQGFADAKISPKVGVFTNFMPDHMNYYDNSLKTYFNDKANIFKYQTAGDSLVVGAHIAKRIPKTHKGKLFIAHGTDVPIQWDLPLPGEHNKENIALAVAACEALRIPISKIKNAVESFKAVEGRLQFVRTIDGVKIYNDNNSTTPEATVAALKSFEPGKVVLIMGGADKGLDMKPLLKIIPKYCKSALMLPGTGTNSLPAGLYTIVSFKVKNISDALKKAVLIAEKGDVIVFSPAFASFGMFKNEYDRNDQFLAEVKKLK